MADSGAGVPQLDQGIITFEQLDKPTQDRLVRNEIVVYTVLAIVALTLVGTLAAVGAIVVDQLHFNNELYRDGGYNHTRTVVRTDYTPAPAAFSNPLALPRK